MSFQFEDESALEELLNQQLDRKRQQPSAIESRISSVAASRRSNAPASQPIASSTPPTAKKQLALEDDAPASTGASGPSRGKLASWLDGKNIAKQAVDIDEPQPARAIRENSIVGGYKTEPPASNPPDTMKKVNTQMSDETLKEDKLQEMSKQRLIQLIIEEIAPTISELRQLASERSAAELERLKGELELERCKIKSMEESHLEQVKAVEARWVQLLKKLELRLETNERELERASERHRSSVEQLEEDHRKQILKLTEGFQARLAEEKQQLEETLRRREDLHELEMESKLKVNFDLRKLETIYTEWNHMIQTTIRELNVQFKSVESLLDKQTIEINHSNTELANKSKLLIEQHEKFDRQGAQLAELAQQLHQLLPSFTTFQSENSFLAKQLAAQIEEFCKRDDEIRARERELQRDRLELTAAKEKLDQERLEVRLDANRVSLREEQLDDLVRNNKATEIRLNEQRRSHIERETQLETQRAGLEMKSNELRQENYSLHLSRKKLQARQEELDKTTATLTSDKKSLANQVSQLRQDAKKLNGIRAHLQRELEQMRRLQKSLVCSLCLDRLFTNDQLADMRLTSVQRSTRNKWTFDSNNDKMQHSYEDISNPQTGDDLDRELARLSRYIEADSKQLEAETKYIEQLSTV